MKEIAEMVQVLSGMHTDTYLKCKYMLMAVSMEHAGTHNFISKLFEYMDGHRPQLIGMKEGVRHNGKSGT